MRSRAKSVWQTFFAEIKSIFEAIRFTTLQKCAAAMLPKTNYGSSLAEKSMRGAMARRFATDSARNLVDRLTADRHRHRANLPRKCEAFRSLGCQPRLSTNANLLTRNVNQRAVNQPVLIIPAG